jgi:hypothetical protein
MSSIRRWHAKQDHTDVDACERLLARNTPVRRDEHVERTGAHTQDSPFFFPEAAPVAIGPYADASR